MLFNTIYEDEIDNLKKCKNRYVNLSFLVQTSRNPINKIELTLKISKTINDKILEEYLNNDNNIYDGLNEVIEYNKFMTYYNKYKKILTIQDVFDEYIKNNCICRSKLSQLYCCNELIFDFNYEYVAIYLNNKYFKNICKTIHKKYIHNLYISEQQIYINITKK
jgi:hypothetical protein